MFLNTVTYIIILKNDIYCGLTMAPLASARSVTMSERPRGSLTPAGPVAWITKPKFSLGAWNQNSSSFRTSRDTHEPSESFCRDTCGHTRHCWVQGTRSKANTRCLISAFIMYLTFPSNQACNTCPYKTDTVRARLFNYAFKSKLFHWPLTFSSNLLADDVTSDSEPNDLELCARVLSHLLF